MTEPPTPLDSQPLGAHVPPAMRAAIQRALAKNKDERFASVKQFYEAFSGAAGAPHDAVVTAGGGAPPRAKTEIGAPIMGAPGAGAYGPPPTTGTNPGMAMPPVSGPNPSNPGMGPVAAVPPGPVHSAPTKSGPPGLVIGLGVLAVLLLAGGGAAFMLGNKKTNPNPSATLDLGTTTTTATADAGAATATGDVPPSGDTSGVGSVAPLAGGGPIPNTGGGTKPATGGSKPGASNTAKPANSIPTPQPVKPPPVDPPACQQYRAAKASAHPIQALLVKLEANCRAAGGTP